MTRAAEWTGPVGDVWAAEWQRTDRSFAGLVARLDAAILDAAAAQVKTIVDIGCGAGATSIAVATARPAAQVTGIDLSPELIAVATARGAALPNLAFEAGAVETRIAPRAPVDLFVSRHGVMFFADPVAGFRALRHAAAPRGAMVFSCFRGAALNPWASEIAAAILGGPPPPTRGYAPGPFAFADPAFVRETLAVAGWHPTDPVAVDFAYRAGAGDDAVGDALTFFQRIGPAAPALRSAAADARAAMLDRIATVIERYRTGNVVDFPAAAWLWSAEAAG